MSKTAGKIALGVGGLLFTVLISYMIYMAVMANKQTTLTVQMERVTVDRGMYATGYLIRDEALLFKESGRVYVPLYATGERVAAGSALAVHFSAAANADAYRTMAELSETLRIYRALDEKVNDATTLHEINRTIYALLRSQAETADAWTPGGAAASRVQLETAALRRVLALSDASGLDAEMASLTARIASIAQKITADQRTMTAEQAGYYSVYTDGYEERFPIAAADTLSAAALRALIAEPAAARGNVIGKMIYGYTWYAAVVLPQESARVLTLGQTVEIRIGGEKRTMSVYRLETDAQTEDVLAVFRSDVPLSDMAAGREQVCMIVTATYTGFKLPVEGLRMVDGVQGVFVLEGSQAVYKPVTVLHADAQYYIVEASETDRRQLFLYDRVILGAKDLYDGKLMD